MTSLSIGLGAMSTEIETSHLLDTFVKEGIMFEHSDGHDVEVVSGLSSQLPHLLVSWYTKNIQLEMFLDCIEIV